MTPATMGRDFCDGLALGPLRKRLGELASLPLPIWVQVWAYRLSPSSGNLRPNGWSAESGSV
jgi:hypothetical protein